MQKTNKEKFELSKQDLANIEKYIPTKIGYPHKFSKKKAHKAG